MVKAGDKAPGFKGLNEKGEEISSEDYKGKKLILFFYPKDSTPGCTMEACNLRDNYEELQKLGFELLGVSADSVVRHQKFSDKYGFPFPLLADEEKACIQAYGVWGPKKFMGREFDGIHRTTFLIDENQVVMHVIEKVKTKDHTNQILELINSK